MTKYLQHHQEKFPDIVKFHDLGTTKGRKIWCLEISKDIGKQGPDKTNVALIAGLHAFDTIGREVLMMFLHSLTKGYTENQARVVKLLKRTRIHIVPMVLAKEMDLAQDGDCTGEKFPKDGADIYNGFSFEKVCYVMSTRFFIRTDCARKEIVHVLHITNAKLFTCAMLLQN